MSYTVLIVDDSKLARMATKKALNSLQPDWPRLEAATADEAITVLGATPADIALLDFNMPGRDGLALAEEMLKATPDIVIAVISANRQQEIVNRALALNATFLPKPLTEEALAEFLKTAVSRLDKKAEP
jgi:YesN/AraC family two-component response regulator